MRAGLYIQSGRGCDRSHAGEPSCEQQRRDTRGQGTYGKEGFGGLSPAQTVFGVPCCPCEPSAAPCPRPPAMLHSPLKTALAYECFQDQASSTLALPSDHKLKTKGTGKQRVQEQVMMTVKRQKQKSSVSSSVGHSNRGKVPRRGASGAGLVLWVLWWGLCRGDTLLCFSPGTPQPGGATISCTGWKGLGQDTELEASTPSWLELIPGSATLLHVPEALGHFSGCCNQFFPGSKPGVAVWFCKFFLCKCPRSWNSPPPLLQMGKADSAPPPPCHGLGLGLRCLLGAVQVQSRRLCPHTAHKPQLGIQLWNSQHISQLQAEKCGVSGTPMGLVGRR